jgi:3-oxoadipate enol-lactonase
MHWAMLDRASIRYERTGDGPQPLVLLHEMGGSLESWDALVPFLAQQFTVIRCDQRGAGNSEKIRAPITFPDFADDLSALFDHLGLTEPVDIVGVAAGACIGLLFASRYPERVRRLIAMNPPTNAEGASGQVLRDRAALTEVGGMRAVAGSALARSYPEEVMGDGSDYKNYLARFVANDPTSYAFILRALAAVDFDGVLERISCPTLFLSGRYDKVRPPAQIREVAKRVRGAQFREIEGGHIAPVQAPAALVREILGFLGPSQVPGTT